MKAILRKLYFQVSVLKYGLIFFLKDVKVGKGNRLEKGLIISKSRLGSYNYVGHFSIMDRVQIGSYCSVASHVTIGGAEHSVDNVSTSFQLFSQSNNAITVVEDDVWIGAKATIRRGVKIGRGAVVGAGAVVLNDVEPYSVVVGVPAKHIRYRFDEAKIKLIENSRYWQFEPGKAKQVIKDF